MNSPSIVSSVSTVEAVIKGKCGNKHVGNTRNLNILTMQLQAGIEQRLDKWQTEIASFRTVNLPSSGPCASFSMYLAFPCKVISPPCQEPKKHKTDVGSDEKKRRKEHIRVAESGGCGAWNSTSSVALSRATPLIRLHL
jgi:hypothetical protein